MATTVALPLIRRGALGADRLKTFHTFERRFVWQARSAVIVVGLTGYYLVEQMDLWWRFASIRFWWMHAMVCVWALFALLLFVIEPFVLHRFLPGWVERYPDRSFAVLYYAHVVLLSLGLLTIFGAVTGSHGWLP